MDARTIARLHALCRVAVGAAYVAAPGPAGRLWVGADGARPGVRVLATAFGARDAAIGLGVLRAVREGHGARPWVRAGVLADMADLIATLRARGAVPASALAGVTAIAAGSVAVGTWLARELD
jgi:hypothetical protein